MLKYSIEKTPFGRWKSG